MVSFQEHHQSGAFENPVNGKELAAAIGAFGKEHVELLELELEQAQQKMQEKVCDSYQLVILIFGFNGNYWSLLNVSPLCVWQMKQLQVLQDVQVLELETTETVKTEMESHISHLEVALGISKVNCTV